MNDATASEGDDTKLGEDAAKGEFSPISTEPLPDATIKQLQPQPAFNAPSTLQIFKAFLVIGATSFGGGVVAYLRSGLVREQKWLDDESFLELLSISQALPGLNATNMAVLVGDRLRGWPGALVAVIGICLPGAMFMLAAGALYSVVGHNPYVKHALRGVAAAAVGLIVATIFQLRKKAVTSAKDWLLVALSVLCINVMGWKVPVVILVVGAMAIFFYRPQPKTEEASR